MFAARLIPLLLVLALIPGHVVAQLRSIPDEARRGTASHVQELLLEINGERVQLAPGGQIRSRENRILVPAAIPPGSLVKYQLNKDGHVHRVWILTDEEAARPDKRRD